MRAVHLPSLALSFLLCSPGLLLAQTAARPATVAPDEPAASGPAKVEPRIERLHQENINSRIDELRVGGETRNITVTPKNAMPAYQIAPESGNRNSSATTRAGDTGARGWNVLGF